MLHISILVENVLAVRTAQFRTYLIAGRTRGSDGISGLPSMSLNRRLRSPIEDA